MRTALTIARRDLRERLRDRSALLVAFVAPLALAAILSSALGGTESFTTSVGLVDHDGGTLAEVLRGDVLGDLGPAITVEELRSSDAAIAAIEDGTVRAAVVVPAGFTDAVLTGGSAELTVLRDPASTVTGDLLEGVARGFADSVTVRQRAIALGAASGVPPSDLPQLAEAAGAAAPAVALERAALEAARASAASYWGPAMAVFFLFFVVSLGPRSLLLERRQGTLPRVLVAPLRPSTLLAGKAASVVVLAASSMGVMWLVTGVAFGASWGDPVGVVLVSLAMVGAAAGVTALIATLARTDEQVDGWTSIVVFTLALLGGSFSDITRMPALLQQVSLLTPNGWAMRAFADLAGGATAAQVAGPVLAVAAFAVVTLALAGRRAHRLVGP
jgi:ABC-2 type transport system permease protein